TSTGSNGLVSNKLAYWKNFNAPSPVFSIMLWLKMESGTDGVAKEIMSTNNFGSSATVGFSIGRNASNKLQTLIYRGASGDPAVAYISTANLNIASGWVAIYVEVNGVGTGTGRVKIGSSSWETFDVAAGVTTNPP